jgi:succinyl-CoA synthetase beta subunit
MNIHEYQAKLLLRRHGVPTPLGSACDTPLKAKEIAQDLFEQGQERVVLKAQIQAGGRGKGTFTNGFKGGVHICKTADEVYEKARKMLGAMLVTTQTGPEGRKVSTLLVEAASDIKKEFYLAVLVDRASSRPMVMVSTEGGMEIETIAREKPEKIIKEIVDPAVGLMPYQARKLAAALGFSADLLHAASTLLLGAYQTWWENDASLLEINPLCLVEQPGGRASLVVDAKMSFDGNALYRQPDILAMRDLAEESPLEIEAGKYDLNYIKLDGNIACIVNGAGLAMATMDIIHHFGGQPANFLDVGGTANKEQVAAAFRIILSDPNVRGILVNIFGGIMRCDIIAQGILNAARETEITVPLVVRLAGANADLGNRAIAESGLKVLSAASLAEAASKIVQAVGPFKR